MTPELITSIILAVLGLLGLVLQTRRRRPSLREEILGNLAIWSQLPDASPGRRKLLEAIESQLDRLSTYESEKRRDPVGASIGAVMVLAFGWLTWILIRQGGWWLVLLLPTGLLFIVGLFGAIRELIPMKRDEKGNPVA